MLAVTLAVVAGLGTHLLISRPSASLPTRRRRRSDPATWLAQAGLVDLDLARFFTVVGLVGAAFAGAAHVVFGGVVPALVLGGFGAWFPLDSHRRRRRTRLREANEAWPALIEEIRLAVSARGRSVPQALLEAGSTGPDALRPAFDAARREWLLTTDLARTVDLLAADLGDPTADITLETLLVAHESGATDLDRRLAALAEDRRQEILARRDAESRLAGARFARRFVLAVPAGMALAGMSIGNGRAAYRSAAGQLVVTAAIVMVAGCWAWAGRVMRIPPTPRVLGTDR